MIVILFVVGRAKQKGSSHDYAVDQEGILYLFHKKPPDSLLNLPGSALE